MFVDLTPEQERIINVAKQLAAEFAPRAAQHDREGSFPFENIARLKETGYTTMTTPKEYGGWGGLAADLRARARAACAGLRGDCFRHQHALQYCGVLYAVYDSGAEGAVSW
jgi:alkylation response protein AidB-like acyl-CoA dehydrogenase